jgi:iron complex outermembrane receptor protein
MSFPITDRFRLLGGARYQKDYKRAAGTVDGALQGNATTFIDNPAVYYDFDGDWTNTQYRVGLEFDLRPQSMVYATYQTGYQPGSVGPMAAMGVFVITSAPASAPLTLKQTTIGIKNRFFDNRLQFNVEAWNTDFKDRPTTFPGITTTNGSLTGVTTCTSGSNNFDTTGEFRAAITATDACIVPGTNIVNTVADQNSRGIDVEVSFLPTAADRIDATFEWLDSRYKSAPHMSGSSALTTPTLASVLAFAAYPGATATNRGTAPANVTAQAQFLVDQWVGSYAAFSNLVLAGSSRISMSGSYQHQFRFDGGSSITPRVTANYRGAYWLAGGGGQATIQAINTFLNDRTTAFVTGVQRPFIKADVNVIWQKADGKLSVTGYVHNVANKATIQNSTPTYTSLDQPRTIGVILNASY